MGIKKGTVVFSQKSAVKSTLKLLRKDIISDLDADSSYRPIVAIDTSVWIRQCLSNPRLDSKVSSQFHAEPKVPVVAVSMYVIKKASIYRKNGFDVILVLDGTSHPLKEEEQTARAVRASIAEKEEQLKEAYTNPDNHTREQVSLLRKAVLRPCEDITSEVVRAARQNKFIVVCSPFESDQQFVALQNQGIIDCVESTDTDLIGQGVKRVIKKVTKGGKVTIMDYATLTTKTLPHLFGQPGVPVKPEEVRLFCCMLGNDYLRSGQPGDGLVKCSTKMKEYLSINTDVGRQEWINNYQLCHDSPQKFERALFAWQHATAFIVKPDDPDVHPRDALKLGEYSVALGSMATLPHQQLEEFYLPFETKLGYEPSKQLRVGHSSDETNLPSFKDFFTLAAYVRTGKPLAAVPSQTNREGLEVRPGAIIDFSKQPIKFVPKRNLELWLSCRGMCTAEMTHDDMETMAARLHRNNTDALPAFVLRGGGAYVAVCTLEFESEESVDWKTKDEALAEIRGAKCGCIDDPDFITSTFSDVHNAKRIRCLKHLKSGSFDLIDIKVSSNLKSKLMPEATFFVVEFCCAPSQKGIGTEGKVYSLRIAFLQTESGWILMPTPYSLCACPVGVLDCCAHRGGGLLLLWCVRQRFPDVDFAGLRKRMPPNIHAVANQFHMVHYIYPALYTVECQTEKQIKKEAKKRNESVTTDNDNDDARDDIELEEENDREMLSTSKKVPLIDLIDNVTEWCHQIDVSVEVRGFGHRYDPEQSLLASIAAAQPDNDTGSKIRKHIRFLRHAKSVKDGVAPKTMYGYYSKYYAANMAGNSNALLGSLSSHMKDPYKQIYNDENTDEGECNDDYDYDGEYGYIDGMDDDSDNDEDYCESDSDT